MILKIQAIGHLGQDAQVRVVGTDNAAISFSVAATKKYKDRNGQQVQETTWISCTIWRKANETTIAQYLKKGTQVYVEGEPSARPWVNAQSEAQASLDCRVDKIELLGSPQAQAAPAQSAQPVVARTAAARPAQASVQQAVPHSQNQQFFTKNEDDLPF